MEQKHKVKVYSTPYCPYCRVTKEFLRERNIKFEEIDVSEDQEAAKEMVHLSKQVGVPVIVIDEKVIVGYDEPALKAALK